MSKGKLIDNLMPGADAKEKSAAYNQAVALLEELGLKKFARRLKKPMPPNISGGERKRLGLVRAILGNPDILILDEPTSELDKGSEAQVRRVIAKYYRRNMFVKGAKQPTIICITHDASLVAMSRPINMKDINEAVEGDEEEGLLVAA